MVECVIDLIAELIESHSGQWNTSSRSDLVLPLPKSAAQVIIHLCDYLVSRKDVKVELGSI